MTHQDRDAPNSAPELEIEIGEEIQVTPFTRYSYLIDPHSWALVREQREHFARVGTIGQLSEAGRFDRGYLTSTGKLWPSA